jgi:ParB family chromosome partitioning protein
MVDEPKLRLGRGLAALIGEATEEPALSARNQKRVPIEFVRANPRNPRKTFDEASLSELTESIREKGILQPIVVREIGSRSNIFEIIAGERRWRAAQRANLHSIPILVIEATDREALELAIVENVQRSDLNPLEESDGYSQLMKEFEYTQADLGRIIGKSRSHIANTLRLSNLPESVKHMVSSGDISAGHARALLTYEKPESLAERIVAEGLSVRDVERITQNHSGDVATNKNSKSAAKREKSPDTRALEKKLQEATGLSIDIKHEGERGEVRIQYKTIEQLDQICSQLSRSAQS